MTKTYPDLSPEGVLYLQQIHALLERLHLHRKLLAEQERDGTDTKPARQALRELLMELEARLSEHQTFVSKSQKADA